MNDERLRQILRHGDPASGDAGLTPDEVRALRRTVLTAIPERRRRLAWLPAAAAAAMALLLLALALRPWHGTPAPPPRVAALPTPAPAPTIAPTIAPVTAPTPAAIAATAAPSPEPPKRSRPARRRAVREPRIALASLPEAREPAVREIRFSTPGGTRVIWQLPIKDSE
jgi:hypothetical protein